MPHKICAFGVDIGGTKIEVAEVDQSGTVRHRIRRPTKVDEGPEAVEQEIVSSWAEA